ncbi:hypothetical protein DPX16_6077 [Anabarilius grahami]|uniref:Uncharacterized protein n=1 Tax=Anabarilius grahami TaxID=495550 RepID=A0A3N0Z180_ANAGA|nr:hypothetical protein DPX16_6077 [Anabarilius grahami]
MCWEFSDFCDVRQLADGRFSRGPRSATGGQATWRRKKQLFGRQCRHRSLPRRRAGWRILGFVLFLFRRWLSGVQRYPQLHKKGPNLPGPKRVCLAVSDALSRHSQPPLTSLAGGSVNVEAAPSVPSHIHPVTSPDPTSGRTAIRVGSLCSTSLPHACPEVSAEIESTRSSIVKASSTRQPVAQFLNKPSIPA